MTQVLSKLAAGQSATILAVDVEKGLFHRLCALGFRAGKSLRVMRRASFNGPMQVRLGATDVILRGDEAACIKITLSQPVTSSQQAQLPLST